MSEFIIRKGDTLPALRMALTANGVAWDLTGCTVTFQMRPVSGLALTVNSAATLVNAAGGIVQYAWQSGETATAGRYDGQWVVTTPAGVQTVPTAGFVRVVITEGLL